MIRIRRLSGITVGVALFGLALAGCVTTPEHIDLARSAPVFSPNEFFAGASTGEGDLRILLSGASQTHVTSRGEVAPDGTLVLVQQVQRGSGPPTTRTWRLHAVGPAAGGRYAGSLTSAEGPVSGEVEGNRLHLRFTAKSALGGLDTEQWLYLQPGGREALNRMVVRKFGIPVASLRETIRKSPDR